MSFEGIPQEYTPRGDAIPASYGYTPLGDAVYHQTNAWGDIAPGHVDTNGQGDLTHTQTNARGDVILSAAEDIIPPLPIRHAITAADGRKIYIDSTEKEPIDIDKFMGQRPGVYKDYTYEQYKEYWKYCREVRDRKGE